MNWCGGKENLRTRKIAKETGRGHGAVRLKGKSVPSTPPRPTRGVEKTPLPQNLLGSGGGKRNCECTGPWKRRLDLGEMTKT